MRYKEYDENEAIYKSGHPVLGLVLGILGILIGLFLCLVAGIVTGAVAFLLGVLAIILGIGAKKNQNGGVGAIIVGVLAIVVSIASTLFITGTFQMLREKAVETQTAPLVEKYLDKPYLGIMGVAMNMPKDEAGIQELVDQLNKLIQEDGGATAADANQDTAVEP